MPRSSRSLFPVFCYSATSGGTCWKSLQRMDESSLCLLDRRQFVAEGPITVASVESEP